MDGKIINEYYIIHDAWNCRFIVIPEKEQKQHSGSNERKSSCSGCGLLAQPQQVLMKLLLLHPEAPTWGPSLLPHPSPQTLGFYSLYRTSDSGHWTADIWIARVHMTQTTVHIPWPQTRPQTDQKRTPIYTNLAQKPSLAVAPCGCFCGGRGSHPSTVGLCPPLTV